MVSAMSADGEGKEGVPRGQGVVVVDDDGGDRGFDVSRYLVKDFDVGNDPRAHVLAIGALRGLDVKVGPLAAANQAAAMITK